MADDPRQPEPIGQRELRTIRKKAGVGKFTFHDLRRTCLTNWAGRMPIHVVQKLAGHSSITSTQLFYLAVQKEDLEKARQIQSEILAAKPTDPELTHSAPNGPPEAPERKEARRASV